MLIELLANYCSIDSDYGITTKNSSKSAYSLSNPKNCKSNLFTGVIVYPDIILTLNAQVKRLELGGYNDYNSQTLIETEELSMGNNKNDKNNHKKLDDKTYEKELRKLQIELVKLQQWVKQEGKRIVVLFEGRDAAGKGGMIKRITEPLNHRICQVVALGVPTEKEKTQWYLQRYVPNLPAAGEIVLFDRSWYNRAGVERVMGFCTNDQYDEFLRICPGFEETLIRSGILLFKYWLDITAEEQQKRFQERLDNPMKRWKISPMDMTARSKWYEYEKAKDEMFKHTDTKISPWYVVDTNDKKKGRLNCISHLLDHIPYEEVPQKKIKSPPLQKKKDYKRSQILDKTFVPEKY